MSTDTPTRSLLPADPKWRAFSGMALTYFLLVLTSSMSFLVLPAIAEDFDVTLRAVGWVVIAESLIIAAFLLPMGALADRIGRRQVLWTGMAVFGLGLVLSGLAPTFPLLIAARVVTAIGNVLAQSVATGILIAAFPPEERGLAMGGQTTAVAVGTASGPLYGGFLVDAISWEWLFLLLALPVVVCVVVIIRVLEKDTPTSTEPRTFDWQGSLLSAATIVLIVLTVSNPFDLAWTSWPILGGAVAAAATLIAFVRWELPNDDPMLQLRLFAIPDFRYAVLTRASAFTATTTTSLLTPIYLVSLRGISSRSTGLVLATFAIGLAFSAQVSGRLYDRLGPRPSTVAGLLAHIAVMIAFAFTDQGTPVWVITVLTILAGGSMGMWNVPANSTMMASAGPDALGVVGAFTNVTRTFGNVMGQAIAAAVVAGVMSSQGFDIPLADVADVAGADAAFIDGWRAAFFTAAGFSSLALVFSARLPGRANVSRA